MTFNIIGLSQMKHLAIFLLWRAVLLLARQFFCKNLQNLIFLLLALEFLQDVFQDLALIGERFVPKLKNPKINIIENSEKFTNLFKR
jgi:hypothetical protein